MLGRVSLWLSVCLVAGAACLPTLAQPPSPTVSYLPFDALVARLRAKPFDPVLRDQIVASLRISMSLYAFKDISLDSQLGAPADLTVYPVAFDFDAALDEIAKVDYASDYDMNNVFNDLFVPRNDAHTAYHQTQYGAMAFAMPFRLQSSVSPNPDPTIGGNRQHIIVHDTVKGNAFYTQAYGYSFLANVTDFATDKPVALASIEGLEVAEIQFAPTLAYLWYVASNTTDTFQTGVSKDQHTRFNLLTHGYTTAENGLPGWYVYRQMSRFGIPIEDQGITLTLRSADGLSLYVVPFNWVGIAPAGGRADFDETRFPKPPAKKSPILQQQQMEEFYHSIHMMEHPALVDSDERRAVFGERKLHQPSSLAPKKTNNQDKKQARRAANPIPPIPPTANLSFTLLPDNTLAFQIQNFEPNSVTDFLAQMQTAVTHHQLKLKGTKLLIDLRGNGGGDICLGYAVLRFLFPQITLPTASATSTSVFDTQDAPFGRYDTVVAPLTQLFANAGYAQMVGQPAMNQQCGEFTPCNWIDPKTGNQFGNETWYTGGPMRTRGGVSRQYTQLFHDSCASYFTDLAPPSMNPGYDPKNVVIVSDGMCGSTCSVFSSFIIYNRLAKSVALGGLFQAFPIGGGPAYPVDAIPHGSMQFWSFPGGEVAHVADIQALAQTYGIAPTDPRVPQLYANNATQTFTLREIYAWNDTVGTIPLEFIRIVADFHFPYYNDVPFTDTAGVYDYLLNTIGIFGDDVCVPNITDLSCFVENGVGVLPCSNGAIPIVAMCTPLYCDAGYEILFDTNHFAVCSPCASGFWRDASTDPTMQSCEPCPRTTSVVSGSGCTAAFVGSAWTNSSCPFEVACGDASDADGDVVKKSTVIALAVSLLVLIVALAALVVYQQRALSKERAAKATSTDDAYGRLNA